MNEIPQFLLDKINIQYPEFLNDILNGYKENRVTTLRVNTLKSTKKEITNILTENNISYENVSWYNEALIINSEINKIKELKIYEEGKIYLQGQDAHGHVIH
jgi:16S rRNA C967 or C1407 C5-methylase (RsmB/RsmF family)